MRLARSVCRSTYAILTVRLRVLVRGTFFWGGTYRLIGRQNRLQRRGPVLPSQGGHRTHRSPFMGPFRVCDTGPATQRRAEELAAMGLSLPSGPVGNEASYATFSHSGKADAAPPWTQPSASAYLHVPMPRSGEPAYPSATLIAAKHAHAKRAADHGASVAWADDASRWPRPHLRAFRNTMLPLAVALAPAGSSAAAVDARPRAASEPPRPGSVSPPSGTGTLTVQTVPLRPSHDVGVAAPPTVAPTAEVPVSAAALPRV